MVAAGRFRPIWRGGAGSAVTTADEGSSQEVLLHGAGRPVLSQLLGQMVCSRLHLGQGWDLDEPLLPRLDGPPEHVILGGLGRPPTGVGGAWEIAVFGRGVLQVLDGQLAL